MLKLTFLDEKGRRKEVSMLISKRFSLQLTSIVVAVVLGWSAASQAAVRPTERLQESYTAQRKPRITVMQFDDTNLDASQERYGPSVSAMMVTFLKSQSQFVVVERGDLDQVLEEWKRANDGATNEMLEDSKIELLEKLDVILHGKVTLIDSEHVEVDAKLLSRFDGRIIVAARHHGPISCLRQIVDRLGGDIERNYLRSYYGRLEVSYKEPTNTHIYLTPVLTNQALDEEKPPIELGQTIYPDNEKDTIHDWVISPTTYTIENVLSGWYTLRLSRPGYRDIGTDYSLWQARNVGGSTKVFYYCAAEKKLVPADGSSAQRCDAPDRREGEPHWLDFLVYIPALQTAKLDITARGFKMVKMIGTIDLEVVDHEASSLAQMRIMIKSVDLDINPHKPDIPGSNLGDERQSSGLELPQGGAGVNEAEIVINQDKISKVIEGDKKVQATPKRCQFLVEEPIVYLGHEPRLVRVGDAFSIDNYAGGVLAFEDYRGEMIPTGLYDVVVWAPYYDLRAFKIEVREGAKDSTRITMARRQKSLLLRGWSDHQVQLTGATTGHKSSVELKSESGELLISLPLDRYRIDANVIGFRPWLFDLNLLSSTERPPGLEVFDDRERNAAKNDHEGVTELRIKDRVWVGGRLERFQRSPRAFYDASVAKLFDDILHDPESYDWEAEDALDEKLMAELKAHLDDIDLLILDEEDMVRMRVIPELETLIREYIASGHALMAFVTDPGNYSSILGGPLKIRRAQGNTSRLKLFPGELGDFRPLYRVELEVDRLMPRLKDAKATRRQWRVVSLGKKKRRPRVLERGSAEKGGYALVWLDTADLVADPSTMTEEDGFFTTLLNAFTASLSAPASRPAKLETETTRENQRQAEGEQEPKSQVRLNLEAIYKARMTNQQIFLARSEIKNHALRWAEYLMYRRLEANDEKLGEARHKLFPHGTPPPP